MRDVKQGGGFDNQKKAQVQRTARFTNPFRAPNDRAKGNKGKSKYPLTTFASRHAHGHLPQAKN